MILKTIRLENYRRFVGQHTIEFASGDKNVTIIRAQNGAGKTGILMALLFGLFGVVKYDQFRMDKDDDIMVSRPLLTNNKSAIASVSIDFTEDNKNYTIIRKVKAQNINGIITQQNDNIDTLLMEDGINTNKSRKEIDDFMNSLIGENIRGFLFFDGVRYMDLFQKDDNQTKKELKQIIEKMLNIGDLDMTIEAIKFLSENMTEETTDKKLNSQLRDLLNKKVEYINKISFDEEKNKEIIEAIDRYRREYNKVMKTKNELKSFSKIQHQIIDIENKIVELDNKINIQQELVKRVTPILLKKSVISHFGSDVKELYSLIASSDNDDTRLLNHILGTNLCVCGDVLNDIKINNISIMLEELKQKHKYSNALVYKSKRILEVMESFDELKSEQDFIIMQNDYDTLILKKEALILKKNRLSKQIPVEFLDTLSTGETKIFKTLGGLEHQIKMLEEEGYDILKNIEINENELENIEKSIEKINEELAVISNKADIYNFYKNTYTKLMSLRNDYLEEAQINISDRANVYFKELLSKDDAAAFKRLNINKNYKIEAFNYSDDEIFSQLSAGQKHLAAMAFTMGLTAVASNAKPTCNFPLVMDTPMSNLDLGNRQRLISLMPNVVNQWILTPMDTELTDNEIEYFLFTNRVGKVFLLEKENETSRIIEKQNVSELKREVK